jgi:hydroxyacylglutathione hydrolase
MSGRKVTAVEAVHIQAFEDSEWGQNCFVVWDEELNAVVVDPGFQAQDVLSYIREQGLQVRAILNTHGHVDHIAGNAVLSRETSAPVLIHAADAHMLTDSEANFSRILLGRDIVSPPASRYLENGEALQVGRFRLIPLHTPWPQSGRSVSLAGSGWGTSRRVYRRHAFCRKHRPHGFPGFVSQHFG